MGEELHTPCNFPPLLTAPGLGAPCPASAMGQPSQLQLTPEQCLPAARVPCSWVQAGLALTLLPALTPLHRAGRCRCDPSDLSSLHPRRARLCRMEVRLLFALGREASIVFRGGGSPQLAWCQGQGATRESGPVSAQAVPWAGAWLDPHSAGLSPLPGAYHTPPSLPHSPLVPVPPFWLLSWHPWVLGAEGLPGASRTWVPASPRFPEGVCLFVCLTVHRVCQMAHSPVSALLQDPSSTGCWWLMFPAQCVRSYGVFWTGGEGWGAQQSSSLPPSLLPPAFARRALLPYPYLLLQMTLCSQLLTS